MKDIKQFNGLSYLNTKFGNKKGKDNILLAL